MNKIILSGYKNNNFSFYEYEVNNPTHYMCLAHGVAEDALRYDYFAKKLNEANISVYVINHIGHGKDCKKEDLGHWESGDFDGCIFNINIMNQYAKSKNPNSKSILFGHSMGSFMAQKYHLLFKKQFDMTILCGCAKADALYKFGSVFAKLNRFFNKKKKRTALMDKLAFGSFNAKFKPNKTNVDWLSKNEQNCIDYVNDEYCGFICTSSFYKEFYKNVSHIPNKEFDNIIEHDYPLLLIGGDKDMVSNMGKKLVKLAEYYKKQSSDVEYILYKDDRHEILNEDDKDQVIFDILTWIGKR